MVTGKIWSKSYGTYVCVCVCVCRQFAYSLACKKTVVSMGRWTANMPEAVSSLFLRKWGCVLSTVWYFPFYLMLLPKSTSIKCMVYHLLDWETLWFCPLDSAVLQYEYSLNSDKKIGCSQTAIRLLLWSNMPSTCNAILVFRYTSNTHISLVV